MVSDLVGQQVLLLDSMLTTVAVISDSTSVAADMVGRRLVGLIPFRDDSTLLVEPRSLSIRVLDPSGKAARVMAIPTPRDAMNLVGGPFGTPGFDAQYRLVYRGWARPVAPPTRGSGNAGLQMPAEPDSAPIVRFDLMTRILDTVASVRIAKVDTKIAQTEKGAISVLMTINPMQSVDDWAVLADGTIAIVRGRDYRIDWLMPDGVRRSTTAIPFGWRRMTDEDRVAVLDSTRAAIAVALAAAAEKLRVSAGTSAGIPKSPVGQPIIGVVSASELPDYHPAFEPGGVRGDASGNVWIRTSRVVDGGAVYDIVNHTRGLVDRVRVPHGRVIIGFGPGIVYMGVLDGTSARLEVARIR